MPDKMQKRKGGRFGFRNIRPRARSCSAYDVSVIIPYHNASRTIRRAVASIVFQRHVRCEIVIINDGSSLEETAKLSSLRGKRNIRVVDVLHRGAAAARNLGAELTRSAVIAFLDADDEIPARAFTRKIKKLNSNPDIGLVFGRTRICVNTQKPTDEITPFQSSLTLEEVLGSFPVLTASNMLVRRAAFEDIGGFDEGLRDASDQEWTARLCSHEKWDAAGVKSVTVRKFVGRSSLWANPDAMEQAWRQVLASHMAKGNQLEDGEAARISDLFYQRLASYAGRYVNVHNKSRFFELIQIWRGQRDAIAYSS